MSNNKDNAIDIIAKNFKQCKNPNDLKSSIIGKVVKLNPIIVSISNGYVLLKENNELEISEWFRFRCNIDKNADNKTGMKQTVSDAIDELKSTCGEKECNLSTVITDFKTALKAIQNELLALKCNLAVGDYVTVTSLEESGKYVLLDKVL